MTFCRAWPILFFYRSCYPAFWRFPFRGNSAIIEKQDVIERRYNGMTEKSGTSWVGSIRAGRLCGLALFLTFVLQRGGLHLLHLLRQMAVGPQDEFTDGARRNGGQTSNDQCPSRADMLSDPADDRPADRGRAQERDRPERHDPSAHFGRAFQLSGR